MIKKTLIALVVAAALVGVCALAPKPIASKQSIELSRIQTDRAEAYPVQASATGAQFVEKSAIENAQAIRFAGAQFVEKSGRSNAEAIRFASNQFAK